MVVRLRRSSLSVEGRECQSQKLALDSTEKKEEFGLFVFFSRATLVAYGSSRARV